MNLRKLRQNIPNLNIVLSIICISFVCMPAMANPLSFPKYEQEVTAIFATGEEAKSATLKVAPLPEGAKCSFGTRWDDSYPPHLAKASMLERAGAKGAFYLCGREFLKGSAHSKKGQFYKTGPRELVMRGHTVGTHTLSHPYMNMISPDEVFRQLIITRMTLEDVSEHSVVSYASPFGWYKKSWLSEPLRCLVEKMVLETGHYVSGDNPLDDISSDLWYPANRFSANDRNPDYNAFKQGLAQQIKLAAKGKSPRVTLGTHSWCDEAGNALQEAWIKKHCIRPDWVQLNDYEYGAYRYSFLNGAVSCKSNEDKVSVFSVSRFDPSALGDEIALSLKFSVEPESVSCDGRKLVKDSKGYWVLPHNDSRMCVRKVAIASDSGSADELPEIAMKIEPNRKTSKVKVSISNKSTNTFVRLYGVVHLPPEFAVRRRMFEVESLAANSTVEKEFPFGEKEKEVIPVNRQLFVASIDYTVQGIRNRLWGKTETEAPVVRPFVKDAAMRTDIVSSNELDDEILKKISAQAGVLGNISDNVQWKYPCKSETDAWYNISVGIGRKIDENHKMLIDSGKASVAVVYQFESTGDVATVFTDKNRLDAFFINGKKISVKKSPFKIPVAKGVNRIVMRVDVTNNRFAKCIQLAVCNSKHLGDPCNGVLFEKIINE